MAQPNAPQEFKQAAYPGTLHHYTPKLTAFEHTPPHPNLTRPPSKPHALLFIGGMGDGLLTVPFIPPLATALTPTRWSVFSVLLSSSYYSWGTHSLSDDSADIAQCTRYIRACKAATHPKEEGDGAGAGTGKIVLMGHSTGSQDVLHYLIHDLGAAPAVDGAILQAPVSDREATTMALDAAADADMHAAFSEAMRYTLNTDPGSKTLVPLAMTRPFYGDTPITAARWLSLQSKGYAAPALVDDLFSSDVDARQLGETFGAIHEKVHLCVLYSGADEHVPGRVDKKRLVGGWRGAVEEGGGGQAVWDAENGGVIEGARHALDGDGQEGQREELVRRVMGFLKKVESDGS